MLTVDVGCSGADERRPMPPAPHVLMYGFSDQSLPLWADTFNCVNIVTGTTEDAGLVQELRAKGVMFAYHVIAAKAPGRETPTELADYWCGALENDLGGALPGGFDAIAIDEIGSPDGSEDSARICEALKLTRERLPDRRIFVGGGWRMGAAGVSEYVPEGTTYDDELWAVLDHCDLLLYEMYLREGNPQFYTWVPWADNLEPTHARDSGEDNLRPLYLAVEAFPGRRLGQVRLQGFPRRAAPHARQ